MKVIEFTPLHTSNTQFCTSSVSIVLSCKLQLKKDCDVSCELRRIFRRLNIVRNLDKQMPYICMLKKD